MIDCEKECQTGLREKGRCQKHASCVFEEKIIHTFFRRVCIFVNLKMFACARPYLRELASTRMAPPVGFLFSSVFSRSELTLNQLPEPITNPRMYTNSNPALALRTTPTGGIAARRRFNAAAAPNPQTDPIESVTALVVIFVCLVTFFYRKRTNTSIVTALAPTAAIVMTSSDATESDEETVLVSK
jgi:hypothetical protein